MNWWIRQMYEYDPTELGAVKVTVAPGAMFPVSNSFDAPEAVTVWAAGSALRTVTFAPGATTRVEGWKAKLRITMVSGPAVAAGGRWEEPQPATTTAERATAEVSVTDRLRGDRLAVGTLVPNT
jgi:hypothetical protein